MLKWILDWWHRRQRAIDVQILWTICCQEAADEAHARTVFAMHAYRDEAWLCLGDEMEAEINRLPWKKRD